MKFVSYGGDFRSALIWATAEVRKVREDNNWTFRIRTRILKDGRIRREFHIKEV